MDDVGEPVSVATVSVSRGEVTCADERGGRLAAGSGDGSLRMWCWRRGAGWVEEQRRTRAHRYGLTCARFSEWGVLVASAGVDGVARVWAARGLAERRELTAPDATAARALVWAGPRLAVGHDDGAVRVWLARAAALLCCVRPHEGAVHALASLSCHALLLTACTEGVLKVFDFEDVVRNGVEGGAGPAPLVWEDGAHDLGVACAAATRGGAYASTGGRDGRVRVWRVQGVGSARSVLPAALLAGHTDAVTALCWAQHLLASASQDRTARIWEPQSGSCVRVLHAHPRYLTAVVLADDLRYMLTGSNDKTVRTWSLGAFSIDDDMEPECNPMTHFGLGDLQGLGPVDDATLLEGEELEENLGSENTRGVCVWRESTGAAVNCLAGAGDMLAAACSDGWVRVYRVTSSGRVGGASGMGGASGAVEVRALAAHSYPALAVDFGAGGALLLTAGLDASARLWDVQSGCELATLAVQGVGGGEEVGSGGVRGARLSAQRPPRLLLASDNGAAAVWDVDPLTPEPTHVWGGMVEAATCCAWAPGARLLVVGGSAGELRLCRPPPDAAALCCESDAHDLGVLSCDFAPNIEEDKESEGEREGYLLASGGRDALVKLWRAGEGLLLLDAIAAHGAAVQSVRWGGGAGDGARLLATGGADRWARVWRVGADGSASPLSAVEAPGAGGAGAVLLLGGLLAVGALAGELALWSIPRAALQADGDGADPRAWGPAVVERWLGEYVIGLPGSSTPAEEEASLLQRVRGAELTGRRLLDDPLQDLLQAFGYGGAVEGDGMDEAGEPGEEGSAEGGELPVRLREEILWLRRDPPTDEMERAAPHALRCPLTHRVLREPVRAADGFTYERAALQECLFAQGEDVRSPMSGRRLASALVEPNRGVRAALRAFTDQYRRPAPGSD